jgi:hypothetical protein
MNLLRNIGLCMIYCKKGCCGVDAHVPDDCEIAELHALADPDPRPGARCTGKTTRVLNAAIKTASAGKTAIIVTQNNGMAEEIKRNALPMIMPWAHIVRASLGNILIVPITNIFKATRGHRGVWYTDEVAPGEVLRLIAPLMGGGNEWGFGVYYDFRGDYAR